MQLKKWVNEVRDEGGEGEKEVGGKREQKRADRMTKRGRQGTGVTECEKPENSNKRERER